MFHGFADGIAFFLAPDGSNCTAGGAMGLPLDPVTILPSSPFVVVEFDTFQNGGVDPVGMSPVTHVGINVNYLKSNVTAVWYCNILQGIENEAWIRGFLSELNSHIAVKRISKGSKQRIKEYAMEVMIISRLRHRNLAQLIGWWHEKKKLLLVYEFIENGNLDFHLFKRKSLLTWGTKYKIAQGLASALLYLHEEWEQCVVHRDIKLSNVMLDSNFNAKFGDFGLARLVDHAKGSQTSVLAGTLGYLRPEY
ncbi:hypothetical protein RHMOL_Rhmol11G0216600 [Rhododendron molle]|uniref:Uncharacterized protein n=1 Tax=Rhododendron molle TaxID=49168 RepID=A0ACC0LVX6_RHOML|nr:hypothetical protein RHMOL_Rhmol11G0216600 [Rhododendron molle]